MEPEPTKLHHLKNCWHLQAFLSSLFPETERGEMPEKAVLGRRLPSVAEHLPSMPTIQSCSPALEDRSYTVHRVLKLSELGTYNCVSEQHCSLSRVARELNPPQEDPTDIQATS